MILLAIFVHFSITHGETLTLALQLTTYMSKGVESKFKKSFVWLTCNICAGCLHESLYAVATIWHAVVIFSHIIKYWPDLYQRRIIRQDELREQIRLNRRITPIVRLDG